MADESLFYYPGGESIYGLAGASLAQALPALHDPYGSPGQNFAVALGGGLVAALLGYKARQEANEAGIRTQELANQMLTAESPAARRAIIESAPGDMFSPNIQRRLLTLDTALTENQIKRQQAAELQKATLQAQGQFELSPLGQSLNQQKVDNAVEVEKRKLLLQGDPEIAALLDLEAARRRRGLGTAGLSPEDQIALAEQLAKARVTGAAAGEYEVYNKPEQKEMRQAKAEAALTAKEQASLVIEERTRRLRQEAERERDENFADRVAAAKEKDERQQQFKLAEIDARTKAETKEYLNRKQQELGIPDREYIEGAYNRHVTAQRVLNLAAKWENLNYNGLQVKAKLQIPNSDVAKLKQEYLALAGPLIGLQGVSKAQSDLDVKLGQEAIFGDFMGITGLLSSEQIAQNLRNLIPPNVMSPQEAIGKWQSMVEQGFKKDDPTIGTKLLGQNAIDVATGFRENLKKTLLDQARILKGSNMPEAEKVQRLERLKNEIGRLNDTSNLFGD